MADITTHELESKDITPSIQWLLVEPRHYQEAQRLKKEENKEAYQDYILSLVFSLDGQRMPPPQPLTKKTIGQVVTAFEERFGVAKE